MTENIGKSQQTCHVGVCETNIFFCFQIWNLDAQIFIYYVLLFFHLWTIMHGGPKIFMYKKQ